MAVGKRRKGRPASGQPRAVRTSVSLSPDVYQTVRALAKQKKVSVSWVLREATERYIAEQWPLLERPR